jgi:hypothetical protein
MRNLNGEMSGIVFDNGKFNVDAFVTLYWDSMTPKAALIPDAADTLMFGDAYTAVYNGAGAFDGILTAAVYDENGRLLETVRGGAGDKTATFTVTNPDARRVKLMAWSGLAALTPYCEPSVYAVRHAGN